MASAGSVTVVPSSVIPVAPEWREWRTIVVVKRMRRVTRKIQRRDSDGRLSERESLCTGLTT